MAGKSQSIRAQSQDSKDKGLYKADEQGEQITIVQEYAEGWSKVSYNGKEGYCKTELLK